MQRRTRAAGTGRQPASSSLSALEGQGRWAFSNLRPMQEADWAMGCFKEIPRREYK